MKWEKEFNLEVDSNWWKTKTVSFLRLQMTYKSDGFNIALCAEFLLQTHFYVKLELQTQNYVHFVMNIQKL